MAAKIKEISEVTIPEEYALEKGEFVKEADSFVLTLRHKLSGARVLVFSNEDNNKVFNIGFRTPPKDETGVPHIIEHTVLCGSEHFPAKDPFVELVKGSLNTFLNATTYPDKTMYPVASYNEKDFDNLMHVYLDAVFYPNIYKYEEIFKQEGWHYELESEEGEIVYNGVVYNEMKGAYSSEESVLERFLMNSLFPDNTYGQESGGDPKCIPNLTYEEYLDFHRTYYHPSNSYIYLYGDFDIEEKLEFIDSNYLSAFPANPDIPAKSEIPLQKPFTGRKDLKTKYAVAQDADCREKTYYAFASAMDITFDQKLCRAFTVLAYVLVEMPGAPVKQALLDAGLGSDVDVDFCDILRQDYFAITTKNAAPGQRQKFYEVIRQTLEKIIEEGIDKKALEAAINALEFRSREADYGSMPKGLIYSINAFKTWLHDDSLPYEALRYEEHYPFLREQLKTDFYEKLIREYLLDNPHAVLIEMEPEPGMAVREEAAVAEKLRKYKESLSAEEITSLVEDTRRLKEYQAAPTPKEDLEKIPMLRREDIDKKIQPYYNDKKEIQKIPVIHHNINTNGIAYICLLFDVGRLEKYVPQISFLGTLFGYMDTRKRSYREFDTETNFYTGGITSSFHIYCKTGDKNDYLLKFETAVKVLQDKIPQALDLLAEMMFETLFSDEKHLREVVAEARSRLKVSLMSSGHAVAASRALSYFSKSAWLHDHDSNLGYYSYLVRLDEHFEEEKAKLMAGCKALLAEIFSRKGMMVSFTGGDAEYQTFEKNMPEFLQKLDDFSDGVSAEEKQQGICALQEYVPVPEKMQEAFCTPAEIQYVAVGGDYAGLPVNYGALSVARHLLNYDYLWNEVRVKGGAYGVFSNFSREGEGFFTSYRDPNLSGTLGVYEKAADYLEHYDAEEREITKTIIGTISGLDTPLTPYMKGNRSMIGYLKELSEETLQKEREQVLSCTLEDIRGLAPVLRAVAEGGCLCVIGNEKRIQDEKELFGNIRSLS